MHRLRVKIALMTGMLSVILSGCTTMQGSKPSSDINAVNGRSEDQALIEEFRGFLREHSDGWKIEKNKVTVALADYVSIEDVEGNLFSLGYRKWLAVCYSGETTYVKALSPSQLRRLKELVGRGSQLTY